MKPKSLLLSVWSGAAVFMGMMTGVSAQTLPRMDPATLEVRQGRLRIQFEAFQGDPSDFEVQQGVAVEAADSWAAVSQAVITAMGPNRFQVDLGIDFGRSAFLRIRRSGLPPLGSAPLLNEVMPENVTAHEIAPGEYWDWIEFFNPSDETLALEGFGIEDDSGGGRWIFPAISLPAHGYLLVYASGLDRRSTGEPLHTDFRLRGSGETLVLTDPFGREVDRWSVPSLPQDQSVGRTPDGGERWTRYTKDQATPGAENSAASVGPVIEAPEFSVAGSFHAAPFELEVRAGNPTWTVRYTTDGTAPGLNSPVVAGPLAIRRSMVVRAIAVDTEGRVSEESARSYFMGVRHTLPVVSLAAPSNNFSFRDGFLYGMGSAVIGDRGQVLQSYPFSGSNAWKDREIEVHLEFFEPDGRVGLRQRAGLKIYGGWGSRGYPQKSMALLARKKYGVGKFGHRVFPDLALDEFESLVLRNSGNDNQSTHQTSPRPPITEFGATTAYGSYFVNGTFTLLRDAMMQRLLEGTDLDRQAYRPAVLYINGEYWGIFNLREKMTEHYVASHHDLNPAAIDVIEGYGDVRAGDALTYRALRDFVNTKSPAVQTNYQFIAERYLEIDNFIDYNLAVIYFQNFDIGNVKCWRPRVDRGRFRWMVFDQDYGFGLWPESIYEPAMARDYADYDNMFSFMTAGSGTSTGWPNAGGRTLLLRRMLLNPGFRDRFIQRGADLLNDAFRADRVVSIIREMSAAIRDEIPGHLKRWSWEELLKRGYGAPHQQEYQPFTLATWESNLRVLEDFASRRPAELRADCAAHFRLAGGLGVLELEVEGEGGGIQVNSIRPETFPWQGTYFVDLPCRLLPIPQPGFRFVEWTTPSGTVSDTILAARVTADATNRWVARFEPQPAAAPSGQLWITEINYHAPADLPSEDWVEIHNPGTNTVVLEGWTLRDDATHNVCVLPKSTLRPGAYAVLCRDAVKFQVAHPGVTNVLATFSFGLGNEGDTLTLRDARGVVMERVPYDDAAPWPVEADGAGATLQLTHSELDHASAAAWAASTIRGGTPGK
ncbi:MAG: CotH kinase family protein [Verrucomicrobiales bacterium]|nr:CotH kinase family protein [Verrucomicrobiales bacterium]